jgi:hypothetical protein
MLALTGRLADGWVPSYGYSPPERLPEMQRRIDEAAEQAARSPGDIRRAYNISGRIGEAGDNPLDGPASRWIETLTGLALEQGMDTFIFWPSEDHEHQTETFAHEVVPAVREAVLKGRT